ncbi:hypothetical protein, partial [Klebsiella pneumoniae]
SEDDCGSGSDLPWHDESDEQEHSDAPGDGEEKGSPESSESEGSEASSADAGDGGSAESEEDKKSDGIGDEPSDAESGTGDIPKPTKG